MWQQNLLLLHRRFSVKNEGSLEIRACCRTARSGGECSDTTIVASNFSSSIAALVLTDDNSAPSSGYLKLRLVNASPGLGPVDIYIVTPGTDLNTVSPTLSNLAFDAATSYQSLTAGNYEVVLTLVGQKFSAIDTGSPSRSRLFSSNTWPCWLTPLPSRLDGRDHTIGTLASRRNPLPNSRGIRSWHSIITNLPIT